MILVLGVSAAVELLLNKDRAARYREAASAADWVIAPDLYVSETANTFWKYHRAGALPLADCLQLAEDGISLIDTFVPAHELWREALAEAARHGHSVYDLVYLTLARRHAGTLVTRDGQMAALANTLGIAVIA